eukprot:gene12138-biopygen8492
MYPWKVKASLYEDIVLTTQEPMLLPPPCSARLPYALSNICVSEPSIQQTIQTMQ